MSPATPWLWGIKANFIFDFEPQFSELKPRSLRLRRASYASNFLLIEADGGQEAPAAKGAVG